MEKSRGDLGLPPLRPLIKNGLKVLFVGFNPGQRSAEIGHYYGHPGNRFWWLLHQAGFTDRRFRPEEDSLLLDLGFGLTDIVTRPSKSSNDLAGWELREGRQDLLDKMHTFRPAVACYNGIGVYKAAAEKAKVTYGQQADAVVSGVIDFVAASPSGRSREPIESKLRLYRQLYELVQSLFHTPRFHW